MTSEMASRSPRLLRVLMRTVRWAAILFVGLLVVLVALWALRRPLFEHTLRDKVRVALEKQLGGVWTVGELQGSWLTSLEIDAIQAVDEQDADGNPLGEAALTGSIQRLSIAQAPWRMLTGRVSEILRSLSAELIDVDFHPARMPEPEKPAEPLTAATVQRLLGFLPRGLPEASVLSKLRIHGAAEKPLEIEARLQSTPEGGWKLAIDRLELPGLEALPSPAGSTLELKSSLADGALEGTLTFAEALGLAPLELRLAPGQDWNGELSVGPQAQPSALTLRADGDAVTVATEALAFARLPQWIIDLVGDSVDGELKEMRARFDWTKPGEVLVEKLELVDVVAEPWLANGIDVVRIENARHAAGVTHVGSLTVSAPDLDARFEDLKVRPPTTNAPELLLACRSGSLNVPDLTPLLRPFLPDGPDLSAHPLEVSITTDEAAGRLELKAAIATRTDPLALALGLPTELDLARPTDVPLTGSLSGRISLQEIMPFLPDDPRTAALSGDLVLDGSLEGTVREHVGSLGVTGEGVRTDEVALETLSLRLGVSWPRISLDDLTARGNGIEIGGEGAVAIGAEGLAPVLETLGLNIRVDDLAALSRSLPGAPELGGNLRVRVEDVAGRLDGIAGLTGTLEIEESKLAFAGQQLGRLDLGASLRDGVLSIDERPLSLTGPVGDIAATATIDILNQTLSGARIENGTIDLAVIGSLVNQDLEGTLRFTVLQEEGEAATFSGPEGPRGSLDISIEGSGLGFENVFDGGTLTAKADLRDARLALADATQLKIADLEVSAAGVIDLQSMIATDLTLDLNAPDPVRLATDLGVSRQQILEATGLAVDPAAEEARQAQDAQDLEELIRARGIRATLTAERLALSADGVQEATIAATVQARELRYGTIEMPQPASDDGHALVLRTTDSRLVGPPSPENWRGTIDLGLGQTKLGNLEFTRLAMRATGGEDAIELGRLELDLPIGRLIGFDAGEVETLRVGLREPSRFSSAEGQIALDETQLDLIGMPVGSGDVRGDEVPAGSCKVSFSIAALEAGETTIASKLDLEVRDLVRAGLPARGFAKVFATVDGSIQRPNAGLEVSVRGLEAASPPAEGGPLATAAELLLGDATAATGSLLAEFALQQQAGQPLVVSRTLEDQENPALVVLSLDGDRGEPARLEAFGDLPLWLTGEGERREPESGGTGRPFNLDARLDEPVCERIARRTAKREPASGSGDSETPRGQVSFTGARIQATVDAALQLSLIVQNPALGRDPSTQAPLVSLGESLALVVNADSETARLGIRQTPDPNATQMGLLEGGITVTYPSAIDWRRALPDLAQWSGSTLGGSFSLRVPEIAGIVSAYDYKGFSRGDAVALDLAFEGRPTRPEADLRLALSATHKRGPQAGERYDAGVILARLAWLDDVPWLGDEINPDLLPEAPISGALSVNVQDLAPLRRHAPGIARLRGALRVTGPSLLEESEALAISGTPREPRFEGRLQTDELLVNFGESIPTLDQGSIAIAFDERGLSIERFDGRLGYSPFHVVGAIRTDEGVSILDIDQPPTIDGLRLRSGRADGTGDTRGVLLLATDHLRARASVDVSVDGPLDALAISGRVDVTEAAYTQPVVGGGGGGSAPAADSRLQLFSIPAAPLGDATLDIAVSANRTILVRNEAVSARASIEGFRLGGTLRVPEPVGSITFPGARVNLLFSRVTVVEGAIRFTEAAPFEPEVSILARTALRGYELDITARGPIASLEPKFNARPTLSDQDAWLLLTTGATQSGLKGESTQGAVVSRAGSLLTKGLLGSSDDPDEKTLAERLQIDIGREISETGAYTLEVEYEYDAPWFLRVERDRFDAYNGGVVWRIRFR